MKFILVSIGVAELSLVLFGCLPRPFNVLALFFNGLQPRQQRQRYRTNQRRHPKLADIQDIDYEKPDRLCRTTTHRNALRKPFTAATFDGMELFGMDYKVATSIIQIFGYMVSKFIGIKLISELKREGRLKFILPIDFAVPLLTAILSPKREASKSVTRRPSRKLKITYTI